MLAFKILIRERPARAAGAACLCRPVYGIRRTAWHGNAISPFLRLLGGKINSFPSFLLSFASYAASFIFSIFFSYFSLVRDSSVSHPPFSPCSRPAAAAAAPSGCRDKTRRAADSGTGWGGGRCTRSSETLHRTNFQPTIPAAPKFKQNSARRGSRSLSA